MLVLVRQLSWSSETYPMIGVTHASSDFITGAVVFHMFFHRDSNLIQKQDALISSQNELGILHHVQKM